MKKFYITTPIYYPSGKPHIGHAYTTLVADVLAKYKKLLGYQTFFVTGTDEHGQKIEEKAKSENITPIELVDKNSKIFLDLWKVLKIDNDFFIRTSYSYHKESVQKVFSELLEKNFIYLSEWSGLYCVSCEENYTKTLAKKEGENLVCQHGHTLVTKKEESYFLKIKEFKNWVIDFLTKNESLVYPKARVNELLNSFLNSEEFEDLSISRTSFKWGIQIRENPKHVIYVWLDALLNYLTALGYKQKNDENFKNIWMDNNTQIVHLMSKEITRFHCIYWPIMLEMLGLRKPTKYISHGWIVTPKGKMSKSLGNVIDPFEVVEKFGVDSFRYYLMKEISFKDDSVFSYDLLAETYNSDLANNFGNLINRTIGMHKKYVNGIVPIFKNPKSENTKDFFIFLENIDNVIEKKIESLMVQDVIKEVNNIIDKCNQFIELSKPWTLFKEQKIDNLNEVLSLLVIAIKKVVFYMQPILVDGTKEALKQLNIDIQKFNLNFIMDNNNMNNVKLNDAQPIYSRIELNKK